MSVLRRPPEVSDNVAVCECLHGGVYSKCRRIIPVTDISSLFPFLISFSFFFNLFPNHIYF